MTLPEGWRMVRLEDVAHSPHAIVDGPFGSNLARQHYTDTGPRVVRLQNIGEGRFIEAEAHISRKHFESLRKHEVIGGDLLVASLGDPVLRACLAPSLLGDAIVKADCIRVRLDDSVNSKFILYSLENQPTKNWAAAHSHGVGRLRLGLKVIRGLPIALPPLGEQRRIVEILEEHLSRLDAGSGSTRIAPARGASLREATLQATVGVMQAPLVPLGALLEMPLSNGRSVKDRVGGFPVLRLTSITSGRFKDESQKEGDWTAAEARRYLVRKGDFLCARGNGSRLLVGAGALVQHDPKPVAFPDTIIRVRPDATRLDARYLSAVWGSRRVRLQIENRARTTAGIYKVNQSDLAGIMIALPHLSVQKDIAVQVEKVDDEIDRLERQASALLLRSASLRRALLQAAFSGQLTGHASDLDRAEELVS